MSYNRLKTFSIAVVCMR